MPSAGAAITPALYSVSARKEVLPSIVITGGVTPKGELVHAGELDFRGMGEFIVAINTNGVDAFVIPATNFSRTTSEDLEFFGKRGLKIVPAEDFWDVAKIALASYPNKEGAIKRLKTWAASRSPAGAQGISRQGD